MRLALRDRRYVPADGLYHSIRGSGMHPALHEYERRSWMNDLELATLAFALILVASMFSVELAISSAIIEIVLGVLVGNLGHLTSTPWIDFLASFARVLL